MLAWFDNWRGMDFPALLLRLVLAVFCGLVIGLERSAKNRPAGFRTHILVCLGGAVAALTGHYLYLGLQLPADVTRISGQVVTGLGFIGAGTIIVTKKNAIKGLTTAAGLWTTGIIGIALGGGYYEGGLLGTAFVLIIETLFSRLGGLIRHNPEMTVEVLYDEKEPLDAVLRFCKDKRMSIKALQIRTLNGEHATYAATITLRLSRRQEDVLGQLRDMPGILAVRELERDERL